MARNSRLSAARWLISGVCLPALVSAQAAPAGTPPGTPAPQDPPAAPAANVPNAPPAPGAPASAPTSEPPTGTAKVDFKERPADQMPGRDPGDPFIPVDDPMLIPVPPADKVLSRWQDALQTVRNRNPNLNRAYAQIQVAQGRQRQVLARSLPTLRATGNFNYHIITDTGFNIFSFTETVIPDPRANLTGDLTGKVPLVNFRNWYDHGTAKHEVRRAELQSKDVERLVVGGLAEAIVSVVTAERLSEVTRVNLAGALSSLELNKKRARLGSANAVDVLRAEQEVAESRSQVIQSDETLRQSREALGLSLGYSEAWGVTPDISLDQLRHDARATCNEGQDIESRPDIMAVKEGKAIAERNSSSVDLSYLPLLDGTTVFALNSNEQQTANRTARTWTVGALLTWNLYDGGQRYGEKTTNEALVETSNQDLAEARQNATIQVTRAVRGVTVAQNQLEVSLSSRKIAVDNARLARIRFVNGTGSSFDMIQTQNTSRQAILDVTVKEFELLSAQIAAFLALASCDI